MALFDQFGPAQAGNGQGPPNMPAVGAPGFNFQSWGHTPPNMAGGLQQFLRGGQPMPNAGSPGTTGQPPQPMGVFGMPPQAGAPGTSVGGYGPQFGASNQPGPPPGAPQISTGFMPPPQIGAAAGASAPQMGAPTTAGAPDAATASGNTNLAGGMQQYLGMMRPR
jgi:hypothetical protein